MYVYHECSYPLLVESISQGRSFLTDYYDPHIKDHPEKITCCPHCTKPLGKLSSHTRTSWLPENRPVGY